MTCKPEMLRRLCLVAAMALSCCMVARPVAAWVQSYGNLSGTTVDYLNIVESSNTDPTPLFGTPGVVNDSLVFNPPLFGAFTTNGGLDFTDGTLNTKIVAKPGYGINKIVVQESGDYTLQSFLGPSGSTVQIAAPVFVRIEAVDGVNLLTPINVKANLVFPNGGVFTLPANAGIGVQFTGSATLDLDAALATAGINGKATKVQYTMDNSLLSFTDVNGTVAFIKKKDIGGVSITAIVPEPSTFLLAGMGLAGMAVLATRRRGK
jgi:hypothetical protein